MSDDKTAQQEEKLVIQEAPDGTAVIELPDSIESPQANDNDEGSDEADEAARNREMAIGGTVDPDAEAAREAKRLKRQKRKEYHREVSREKDIKLSMLQKQNNELLERLAVVEKKTLSSELARVDKAMEDQHNRILFAKAKIKEAAETGNGDLMVSAQDMLVEASQNFNALKNLKQRSVQQSQQPRIQAPDPRLQEHASEWMSRNEWYDPQGRDQDSRITLTIDQALADEGFDPKTAEYWEELDNRLQKYLPHRYTGDTEVRTAVRTSRPRSVVTGSERTSASSNRGGNTFTLTRDQVNAMKEAGFWDDPVKRDRMIKRYALEARQQQNSR